MPKLHVIIASTRPGRAGLPIGKWFLAAAKEHGKFDTRLVDLLEVNLPHLDEPKHPRLREYQHAHTKAWSATIAEADAFVFVTPEYNYSSPPALLNALDFLFHEWAYKPVSFVSYGGVSGGTRSVQMTKLTVTCLKMMPIPEAAHIAFFSQHVDEAGEFKAPTLLAKAAGTMLDELLRWTDALKVLRS